MVCVFLYVFLAIYFTRRVQSEEAAEGSPSGAGPGADLQLSARRGSCPLTFLTPSIMYAIIFGLLGYEREVETLGLSHTFVIIIIILGGGESELELRVKLNPNPVQAAH